MSIIPGPEGAPKLQNEALYILFMLRWELPAAAREDFLRELSLDSLAADCCTILNWGVDNYDTIVESEDADNKSWAVIHAFFFAGALGRPEVVSCMLRLLAEPEDVLDFYFGDMITEECWWPLRQYLPAALDDYMAFLRREDVYEFAKSAVLSAMLHASYAELEQDARIMPALMAYAAERASQKDGFPGYYIGELAVRLIDDGTEEGLAIGSKIFEAGLVDTSLAGDFDEVMRDRGRYPNPYARDPYGNLDAIYGRFAKSFGAYSDEDVWPYGLGTNDPTDPLFNPHQPIVKAEKIGRNDPCPCGSGKKYKKCCLVGA